MKKSDITPALAGRLIAAQFPPWAGLPIVPVEIDGWDNTTFRLGGDMLVRLPSGEAYVPQIEKEQRWLPIIGQHLSVRIPEPVEKGQPCAEFPRPWSIYRWIDGEPAGAKRPESPTTLAAQLAAFLRELQAIDAHDGPAPGAHSFFRGGPLSAYDVETRASIQLLADEIDADGATVTWQAALDSSWDREPVWVHGDVAPSNLILREGRLCGVIDFGCCAVGDPACDLVMAWTFFNAESRERFRREVGLDDDTWRRARGWALWKAVVNLAKERRGQGDTATVERRWGWSASCRQIVDVVIAEHHRGRTG